MMGHPPGGTPRFRVLITVVLLTTTSSFSLEDVGSACDVESDQDVPFVGLFQTDSRFLEVGRDGVVFNGLAASAPAARNAADATAATRGASSSALVAADGHTVFYPPWIPSWVLSSPSASLLEVDAPARLDFQERLLENQTAGAQAVDLEVSVTGDLPKLEAELQLLESASLGEALTPIVASHPLWIFDILQLRRTEMYICCVALFLAGILCSAGGIGGGGIYVTVLMVAGGLPIVDAVPLSKAVVFLGSISSLVLNMKKTISEAGNPGARSLIDFTIVRLVVPGSLAGTYFGVLINRHVPALVIVVALFAILLGISVMVTRATFKQYQEESEAEMKRGPAQVESASGTRTPHAPESDIEDGATLTSPVSGVAGYNVESAAKPQFAKGVESLDLKKQEGDDTEKLFSDEDAARLVVENRRNSLMLQEGICGVSLLVLVVFFSVLRFHSGRCETALFQDPSGQHPTCHHPLFFLGSRMEMWMRSHAFATFIRTASVIIPLIACFFVTGISSKNCGTEGWAASEVGLYTFMSIITGCLAGLVGIGGGLIFSPFFLLRGIDPAIAVATSSTCVIFTSSSTTMQYLFSDRIIVSLAVVYGFINLVASYSGTRLVHMLQDKWGGKKSYISGIVAVGVVISTGLTCIKLFDGSASQHH